MNDERIDALLREVPQTPGPGDHVDDGVLISYRAGELAEADREHVEAHLAACAQCRGLLEAYGAPVDERLVGWAKNEMTPRSRWPAVVGGFGALAAAAAVTIVFLLPPDSVPEYTLSSPRGGVALVRGDAPPSDVFVPTSKVRWTLEPHTIPKHDVYLRVFVEASDRLAEVTREGSQARGDTGVMRFEASAERLFGEGFGIRTVHFVVTSEPAPDHPFDGPRDTLTRSLAAHDWRTSRVLYQARASREDP